MATGGDKRKTTARGAQSLRAFLPEDFLKDIRKLGEENAQLCVLWERHVNAPLSLHVRPVRLDGRTLHVNADSPIWTGRARHEAREMIVRLRREKLFKDITRIEVKTKPKGGLDREMLFKMAMPRETVLKAKPMTRTTSKLLETLAHDVTDPALREALGRLAESRKK